MCIDWESSETTILLNPRLGEEVKTQTQKQLEAFKGLQAHVWVASSGSSGIPKWAALSKGAILASAQAVNDHLQSNLDDIWIHALPDFHVGGLGIWARAYLSRALVVDYKAKHEKWDAARFHQIAHETKATLSALVPTQVHDLVLQQLPAPKSLRAIIVGGAALEPNLYKQATLLGWPLLPSYGMTECASQVATAPLHGSNAKDNSPHLIPLKHLQVAISDQKTVSIKGSSLLTGYAIGTGEEWQFVDPKISGWLHTQDRGHLDTKGLQILGRVDRLIKIGGENIDMDLLEALLSRIKLQLKNATDCALVALPDPRLGHIIHFLTTDTQASQPVVDAFQTQVLPLAKIKQVHQVPAIPRSPLGKLQYDALKHLGLMQ